MFCSKPFEWMEVAPNGDVFLCCPGWLSQSVGNILKSSVEEVWNGPKAQKIRESILDGSFSYCQKSCPHLTNKNGCVSYEPQTPEMKIIKDQNKTKVNGPIWINLAYDLSCNLACPSCRPEMIQFKGALYEKAKKIQNKLLEEAKNKVEWIYITGSGDPFGSKLFRELLLSMKRSDYPGVKIYLHTNGLLLNEKMWEKLEEIHSIIKWIHVSIDAASEITYGENRGGNWKNLLSNLDFISSLRGKYLDCFEISMVVQNNNWREMKDFVSMGNKLKVDKIYFTPIEDWDRGCDLQDKSVHLKEHPDNEEFIQWIKSPEFQSEKVDLGTLTRCFREIKLL